jgi:hypothetical protein
MTRMGRWKIVIASGERHVMPIDDLKAHYTYDCWCVPFDEDGIWVHNSMDGRELYERGERRVS